MEAINSFTWIWIGCWAGADFPFKRQANSVERRKKTEEEGINDKGGVQEWKQQANKKKRNGHIQYPGCVSNYGQKVPSKINSSL